ncbi:MAG: hypothetical protein LBL67_05195 [Coriobacteriales bacterium]|jgi:hypothetical protein|nr:hypothetical protein [Coriobacteriales bacterium]
MYLKKTRSSQGRTFLSAVYNYRGPDGKSHSKTYRSFGYLDQLEQTMDDPIAQITEQIAEWNDSADVQDEIRGKHHTIPGTSSAKSGRFQPVIEHNLGYIVPLHYYQALTINSFWGNVQQREHISYDLNAIFRNLVMLRVLGPTADSEGDYHLGRLFERLDFGARDVSEANSVFARYRGRFLRHLGRHRDAFYPVQRDLGYLFLHDIYYDSHDLSKTRPATRSNPTWSKTAMLCDRGRFPLTLETIPPESTTRPALFEHLSLIRLQNDFARLLTLVDMRLRRVEDFICPADPCLDFMVSLDATAQPDATRQWLARDDWDFSCTDYSLKARSLTAPISQLEPDGQIKTVEKPLRLLCVKPGGIRDFAHRHRLQVFSRGLQRLTYQSNAAFRKAGDLGRAIQSEAELISSLEQRMQLEEQLGGVQLLATSDLETPAEDLVKAAMQWYWMRRVVAHLRPARAEDEQAFSFDNYLQNHLTIVLTAAQLSILSQIGAGGTINLPTISRELNRLNCFNYAQNLYLVDYWSPELERLLDSVGINLPHNVLTTAEVKHLISLAKQH